MSLHNAYKPIQGQLLNHSPPPSLDTVVNELVGEEAHLVNLQDHNKLNVLAITPSSPPTKQPTQSSLMHLALAIITNNLTKSFATIVSVLATILRLVTIATNLLLLLLILSLPCQSLSS